VHLREVGLPRIGQARNRQLHLDAQGARLLESAFPLTPGSPTGLSSASANALPTIVPPAEAAEGVVGSIAGREDASGSSTPASLFCRSAEELT